MITMKKILATTLIASMIGVSSGQLFHQNHEHTTDKIQTNQNLIINTSDPFLVSASLLLSENTYNSLQKDWTYFPVLNTIYKFDTQGDRLPDEFYSAAATLMVKPDTNVKVTM
ncbi:hypothetical protein [Spiroplasma endosymbiont of Virgichneumon dumeticola]|uniref:hypothetical protein n=1 Tax=Spiroplasma endosymbiont of Virgichneumon dumeticola TaxID=3139323 RepID=UPI0035C8C9BA